MRPTVLLFDIDGTLLTTGGVGRRALERAFEQRYQKSDACASFRLDGMTDRRIVRMALEAIGISPQDVEIEAVLATYLELLDEEVANASLKNYYLHAGMKNALDAALTQEHIAVGLGTGNIRQGARLKLEKVGVYNSFSFGGFGCDHEIRVELIRRGAERGAERLNVPLEECRVVVIGDTPKDVEAAQGIGAESIGVGTGHYTPQALQDAGATHAFPNLSSPEAISALLGR